MIICGHTKTPPGWYCTRELGHDGPCAARSMSDVLPLPTEVEALQDQLNHEGRRADMLSGALRRAEADNARLRRAVGWRGLITLALTLGTASAWLAYLLR